jgi:hypothetical protein
LSHGQSRRRRARRRQETCAFRSIVSWLAGTSCCLISQPSWLIRRGERALPGVLLKRHRIDQKGTLACRAQRNRARGSSCKTHFELSANETIHPSLSLMTLIEKSRKRGIQESFCTAMLHCTHLRATQETTKLRVTRTLLWLWLPFSFVAAATTISSYARDPINLLSRKALFIWIYSLFLQNIPCSFRQTWKAKEVKSFLVYKSWRECTASCPAVCKFEFELVLNQDTFQNSYVDFGL